MALHNEIYTFKKKKSNGYIYIHTRVRVCVQTTADPVYYTLCPLKPLWPVL